MGLIVLIVYPLLWELNVSFTKMSLRNFRDPGFLGLANGMFVGIDNYVEVFTQPGPQAHRVLATARARPSCGRDQRDLPRRRLGMALALLLHRQMRGKGIYRALIILPWAIPQIIALLDLADRVQLRVRRREPAAGPRRRRAHPVAVGSVLELRRDDHHQRLAWRSRS